MAQVNIEKTETPANDPSKVTLPPVAFKPFVPTGKQLAELSRAAKCDAHVFKDGAGKDALAAIVKAAMETVPAPPAPTEEGKPLSADAPRFCWRCGADDWVHHPAEATRKTVRCQRCGARYVTPKF